MKLVTGAAATMALAATASVADANLLANGGLETADLSAAAAVGVAAQRSGVRG